MGKSTTLTRLTEKRIDSTWLIRLNLKECQQGLARFPEQPPTWHQVADFLWAESGNQAAEDALGKWVFQSHLQTLARGAARPLLILLDGFDEISESAQHKVKTLLQFFQDNLTDSAHQVVVTTRRHPQLEQSLSMLYTLAFDAFNRQQQQQFLQDFWHKQYELLLNDPKELDDKAGLYAHALLEQIDRILDNPQEKFIGIPLQTRLLAEAFQDRFLQFATSTDTHIPHFDAINLATVYQHFVNAKYKLYFKEKSSLSGKLTSVQESWIREKLTKNYRRLGLQALFPKEVPTFLSNKLPKGEELTELYRAGLIQQDKFYQPEFVHRSLAEYFVADLISSWLRKTAGHYPNIEELLLTRILIAPSSNVIRIFLNDKLSELTPANGMPYRETIGDLWAKRETACLNEAHQTALHVATQSNQLSITAFLLNSFKEKPEQLISLLTKRDLNGDTALYIAVERHHDAVVNQILESINNHSATFKQRLLLASVFRTRADEDNPVVQRLFKKVAEDRAMQAIADAMSNQWPLIEDFLKAVKAGDIKAVTEQLEKTENQNIRDYLVLVTDNNKRTALHFAAEQGHLEMVQLLLNNRADIEARDRNSEGRDNWTPLHLAAKNGHLAVVQELINRGAAVDSLDRSGSTALQLAAKFNHLKVVQYLVEDRGADVTVKDKSGLSIVAWAAKKGHKAMVAYLANQKADINAVDRHGMTAIQHAAKANQWEVVQYLIEQGADINRADQQGKTLLQLVLNTGNQKRVKYLVEHQAEIKQIPIQQQEKVLQIVVGDDINDQAFYAAIRTSNTELLDLLIHKYLGEDKDSPDSKNRLDRLLSQAYERLTLMNVPVSPEMAFLVKDKLIELRFFSENNEENAREVKVSYHGVMQRIEMVVEQTNKLCQEYTGTKEIDRTFIVTARFIAQNIRVLKRHLQSTYDRLPWEEMEFCIANFIASKTKDHYKTLVYQSVLDKTTLLQHLQHFSDELNRQKSTIKHSDVNSNLPKSGEGKSDRHRAVDTVLSHNPQFQTLYDDHEIVRTVYSLKRIEAYIKTALSVDFERDDLELGRLVLERTLQVVGESLKNSLESPNVSDEVHAFLMRSAPRSLRKILTTLRDLLSHAHTLKRRMEFVGTLQFLKDIQNDFKKVNEAIGYVLYKKKIAAVRILLNRIINSSDLYAVKSLVSEIDSSETEEIDLIGSHPQELTRIEQSINALKRAIGNPTAEEAIAFHKIDEWISAQQDKLPSVKLAYLTSCDSVGSFINTIDYTDDLVTIKSQGRTLLSTIKSKIDINYKNLEELFYPLKKLLLDNGNSFKISFLIRDALTTILFESGRVKGIEKFKSMIEEKESIEDASIERAVEEILDNIKNYTKDKSERDKLQECVEEHDIYIAKKELIRLVSEEPEDKAKYEKLFTTLKLRKKKQAILNNYIKGNQWDELKREKKGIRNSYQTLIDSVKNAIEKDNRQDVIKCFIKFSQLPADLLNRAIYGEQSNLHVSLNRLKNLLPEHDNPLETKPQAAIEMVMLDVTDAMHQENHLADNRLFFEAYFPTLMGKALRNYLAHGDLFIDSFLDAKKEIKANALQLIARSDDFMTNKNQMIGQKTEENIAEIEEHYAKNTAWAAKADKLFQAVQEGDFDKVNRDINDAVDINARDISDHSGLYYAIRGNSVKLYEFFSKNGLNNYNFIPLEMAIKFKSNMIFNHLIKNFNGDINRLLFRTVQTGNPETVKIFLNHPAANIKMVDKGNWALLHWAAQNGHKEVTQLLIAQGAVVDAKTQDNWTPLHMAAYNGHKEVAQLLVDHHAVVDAKDKYNVTPLHLAALNGDKEVAQLLIDHHAVVNAKTQDNWTPLHMAAQNGHKEVTQLLIDHHAVVDTKTQDNWTPLHRAAYNGHKEVAQLLIAHHAVVDTKTQDNWTSLHLAAKNGHKEVAQLLIAHHAVVNAKTQNNVTPLHMAAQNGHKEVTQLLIAHHAVVDTKTQDNWTPLHLAAHSGHKEVTQLLIEKHADVNAQSKDNWTPLHLAAKNGHKEVAQLLIAHHAVVDAKDKDKETPLHWAAKNGHKEVAQLLIAHHAVVDAQSKDKETPLHRAAYNGHKEAAQLAQNLHLKQVCPFLNAVRYI
ncbi:MAG: ankyrin repeat domain-containing protein (plasmid) [Candidatus Symbiodolus clandestinus]